MVRFDKILIAFTVSSLLLNFSSSALALTIGEQQEIHQQEQQRAREALLAPEQPDVRFEIKTEGSQITGFPVESPCFTLDQVVLHGLEEMPEWLRLTHFADLAKGQCLGGQGINMLMESLQNRMIDSGYVTTRVLAPEQDLTTGTLQLLILPGKVRDIVMTEESNRYLTLFNTLPIKSGKLLDLRDIEQGLENLQRIPHSEVALDIIPTEQPGESDIAVSWQQRRIWRLAASFDDSGTKGTEKYQGGLTFYLDNISSLGDMFYISGGHDTRGSNEKGTRNYTMNYSVPFGYWLASFTASGNQYHQTVAGSHLDYVYSGRSQNKTLRLNRLLHRSASHKTSMSYDIGHRISRNFVNDTELEIQRRETAFWKAGLNHRHYFERFTFDGGIDYQHGTRWFGARSAPEEQTGDATALSRIVRMSASVDVPFRLADQRFSYSSRFQSQVAKVPLTPQDRFSLGGRWSVRGFDGELSLSADNGWYVRNDLTWITPITGQQLYLGADFGEVGGTHSHNLVGKQLAGSVVGIKGTIPVVKLNYDAFASTPIYKPKGFHTSHVALGFSLFWEY